MNAKLTIKHDSLSIAVADGAKRKLTLAINRRGVKCSGSFPEAVMRAALTAFVRLMDDDSDRTNGQKMDAVKELAERSSTIDEFIAGLETT